MGFEIGKKYRRRDGKIAKCIGIINATDPFKRVCWESEGDFMRGTNEQGRGSDGSEKFDITYLEPIREPVKVTYHMRFLNVYPSGYVAGHRTRCDADSEASFDRIGVYELPAEIEVTPAR